MSGISAIIIAFNEEKYIGQCLSSLKGIADEIIVVDSHSTDSTAKICSEHNVRCIQHPFEGFVEQKSYALSQAKYNYVLSLDADEAIGEELKGSILKIKENLKYDGYLFNRLHNYCGQWIRHSRLYPDKQLRLFNKEKGKWDGYNVHEKFIMNPGTKVVRLKGDMYHWNFSSIEEHIEKINKYTTMAAIAYFKAGKKAGPWTAAFHMFWCFFRSYFLRVGFLDGYLGYMNCSITAFGSHWKYAKLRKLHLDAKKSGKLPK